MTTIVSSLLTNINQNRNIEKYVEYGKKLLNTSINKVIYMEQHIYELYFIGCINDNTIIHFIEKKDLYLYEYYNLITNFNIITDAPYKDNIEYMFVQCNKTEWVKQAIEEDPFHSDQFIWVDFGIYHMINNETEFEKYICKLSEPTYECVRIASGIFFNNDINIYQNIIWFFLGSIFGGNKEKLLKFAELMKSKCISIIETKKTICWEINIWFLIYQEYPELFSCYNSSHTINILIDY